MEITENLFLNYLKCPYKAHRLLQGESGHASDYEALQNELHGVYVRKFFENGVNYERLSKAVFLTCGSRMDRELLKDVQLGYDDISAFCDGMIKNVGESSSKGFYSSIQKFCNMATEKYAMQ